VSQLRARLNTPTGLCYCVALALLPIGYQHELTTLRLRPHWAFFQAKSLSYHALRTTHCGLPSRLYTLPGSSGRHKALLSQTQAPCIHTGSAAMQITHCYVFIRHAAWFRSYADCSHFTVSSQSYLSCSMPDPLSVWWWVPADTVPENMLGQQPPRWAVLFWPAAQILAHFHNCEATFGHTW
jgi:hypothetical protein